MSDLSATNCGCGCEEVRSNGGCGNFLWIIILLSCCGGCNGFGNGFGGGCGNGGCGDNNCLWLILLLCCCGGCNCF